jgi:hypothetical protein
MKNAKLFFPTLATTLALVVFAGCSKSGDADDNAGGTSVKSDSQNVAGVTLDAATQARIGLEIAIPVATQWQPETKAYGEVLDPSKLAGDVADLESARVTAGASAKEYERQKTLAAQNNSSVRALETAQAAALHDDLALTSALAKFKSDWGPALVENGKEILPQIASNRAALVRIDLPAGETQPAPVSARLSLSTDETNSVTAGFFDAIAGVDPQTQGRSILFLVKGQTLPPNAAVAGFLRTAGEPVNGVTIPAAAVLRYEGEGWIYVQTGTNQFMREAIPLDCPVSNGWFIAEKTPLTNGIVVTGAQTVLSAELSGGSFNTGERD